MPAIRWYDNDSVDEAITEARALGRALLIDFWDPTCLGCAKLFATTYRSPAVECALGEHFIPLKYNTTRPGPWYRELNGRVAHSWHPHLLVADHRLVEGRRFIGYLSRDAFLAQLNLGLGALHLYHRRFAHALEAFRRASQPGVPASIAAEALYWEGVAAYRVTGDIDELRHIWHALRTRHPENDWAIRADCLDVVIPAEGFRMDDPDSVQLTGALVTSPE